MDYRGFRIIIEESNEFDLGDGNKVVSEGLIYTARSKAGRCWALTPGAALADMYDLIDSSVE